MLAHSLLFCAAVLAAPSPVSNGDPDLSIAILPAAVEFQVTGPEEAFVGVAIASLQPDLVHYLVGLPPLLADFVVLDFGLGDAEHGYTATVLRSLLPGGVTIYAQGVALDSTGLRSSRVGEFRLPR
ncbi:MAG TPA: hypothetical protein VFZ65_12690 [Planctomycetota bacterium]|nr:hypothetical protein [Planctomycetota bacterium]